MKKKLLPLFFLSICILSCKKNDAKFQTEPATLSLKPIEIIYKDTISNRLITTKSDSGKKTSGLFDTFPLPSVSLTYQGNGSYFIVALNNQTNNNWECTYSLFKDNVQIYFPGNTYSMNINSDAKGYQFQGVLSPGSYTIKMTYHEGPANGVAGYAYFTIYSEPVVPNGKLAIFRYRNSRTGQHLITSTWQELASGSNEFLFEAVQGYIYPNSTVLPNLVPIYRFYYAGNGDHYCLNTPNNAPNGYVLEGLLGYYSKTLNSDLTLTYNQYYNSGAKDHLYSTPPENPTAAGYVLEGTFGYIVPK